MARLTLQGDLLEALGPRIVNGHYPAGEVIRSETIETEFQMSRTVVREALKVLESMNMVSIRRSQGLTVRPAAEWNLFDPLVIRWRLAGGGRVGQLRSLTELRLAIEPVAAAGAAAEASDEQRARLIEHAHGITRAGLDGDGPSFLAHDRAFHQLVLEASGNEMFASLSRIVPEVFDAYAAESASLDDPEVDPSQHLHVTVAEAIAAGDAGSAESATREMLTLLRHRL
ncbi:FadR/GntR family transcriptional regulator [Microbacterium sp. 1.5R]|uniref:FadR/GntR family transcriptional regulator n=1 Tax=Microbacterium sp. 1.5R TaxID=1916917 RepID=UPI0011A7F81F|nr:FCD domain-containing protein [Microbacterium sp. 1.5R]